MERVSSSGSAALMVEMDDDGFIRKPQAWNRDVANFLAVRENLTQLSEDHWRVIDCVRNYYQEYAVAPPVKIVCKITSFTIRYLYELFPSGFAQGACKVAGLPKPDPHLFGHPQEVH